MTNRLFIAEKPALAKAIFEGLGGGSDEKMRNGFFEIGNDKITSCFGHMLQLLDPEDYDERYKKWNLKDLPMPLNYPPKLKPIEDTKDRLDLIIKMIGEADVVVHAGDNDQTGQLLIDEILGYIKYDKPVKRVLISDLNLVPVQKALADLRNNEDFLSLSLSALALSVSDQYLGYNLTRAFTVQGGKQGFQGVLNVGRVQSAVYGLINSRTLANESHEESFYFPLTGEFKMDGISVIAEYQPSDDDITCEDGRLIDEGSTKAIIESARMLKFKVNDVKIEQDKRSAPMPYSLSTLQQACAKKWGYNAEQTLNIAQRLYDNFKLLTYPRSDCKFLSDQHLDKHKDIFDSIVSVDPSTENAIKDADSVLVHRAFNAEKITAHHGICPTEKIASGIVLTEEEKNVYRLVALNFISLFYPQSVRDKTTVVVGSEKSHTFISKHSDLVSAGWERILATEKNDKKDDVRIDLSHIKNGASAAVVELSIDKKSTKPPKYFVESTLLSAMTRASRYVSDETLRKALDEKDSGSIGTEATRAEILSKISGNEKLVVVEKAKGYKEKIWRTTLEGQEFCSALPDKLTLPDTSALWSQRQLEIKDSNLSVPDFLALVENEIADVISDVKTNGISITPNMENCRMCKTGYVGSIDGKHGIYWTCNEEQCGVSYPDKGGKPDLSSPKRPAVISSFPCEIEDCKAGLIRRKKKKKIKGKTGYLWTCSNVECDAIYRDSKGKPSTRIIIETKEEPVESE